MCITKMSRYFFSSLLNGIVRLIVSVSICLELCVKLFELRYISVE